MKKYVIWGIAVFMGVVMAAGLFYYNNFVSPPSSASDQAIKVRQAHTFPGNKTLYQMGLYLDLPNRALRGSMALQLINNSGKTIEEIWFTAYPNAFRSAEETPAPSAAYYDGFNPGKMEFDYFKVNGKTVNYQGQGVAVRVSLGQSVAPGQPFEVETKFTTKIPRLAYRFGSKDSIFMLAYSYPILNVLDTAGWHQSYNARYGDPFCLASANYLVRLNLPDGYNFASPGTVVDALAEDNGRQSFLIKAQNIRDFSLAVMYDYKEISQQVEGSNIKCYYPAEGNGPGHNLMQQAYEILNYYSDSFGPYPYEDLKIVFTPLKGLKSCELSGMIFLSNDMINSFNHQEYNYFFLAHEIAHQWWYALVGNDQLKEPWLDEGLANWSAYKYLAEIRGAKTPAAKTSIKNVNLSRELQDMKSGQDYNLTAYDGGAGFWFGLEKKLGKKKVKGILQDYVKECGNNIATGEDIKVIINQKTRRDMEKYYQTWF